MAILPPGGTADGSSLKEEEASNNPGKEGEIFISYAREDLAVAKRLVAELTFRKWSVWWDEKIRSGRVFDEVIEAKLNEAKCIIVLWSSHSVGSHWVKAEAAVGLKRDKLLSVRIEPDVALPVFFTHVNTLEITNWENVDSSSEFHRLLEDLEAIVERKGPPTPQATTPPAPPRAWNKLALPIGAISLGLLAFVVALWFVLFSLEKRRIPPILAAWQARAQHASVIHDSRMWILGGENVGDGNLRPMNDVWASLDGRDWEQIDTSALWAKRSGHTALSYDGSLWVLGGEGSRREPLNDVWIGNGLEWRRVVARAAWAPRFRHASVVFNNRIWVLGGYNQNDGELGDAWFSNNGRDWIFVARNAFEPPRRGHAAVAHEGKIWILGGDNHGTLLNDVWSSSDGVRWNKVTASAPWEPRSGHSAASFRGRLWILGGGAQGTDGSNDVWSSKDGVTWEKITAFAPWHARQCHSSVVFQRRLWILGGYIDGFTGARLNDVWSSLDGEEWR